MARPFTVQNGVSHAIEPSVGEYGIIQILSTCPPLDDGRDYTSINLKDDKDNTLLHMSFRPHQGFIAVNQKVANKDWDYSKEIRVPFKENLPSRKLAKITILDRGDNYFIVFTDGPGLKYPKVSSLVNKNVSSIDYHIQDECPIFSELLSVRANVI
ncbi:galactoside-binding lectin protein, partial [Rhizoctonia solani AG-3 Rhs1AP]